MAVDMSSMSSGIMQFNSVQDELEYYRSHAENLENTLQETRAALDEFQISSRELEEELEKELQTTEKAYKDLKARCEQFKREADDWKSKYTQAKHEQNMAMMQMQREIDILRATEEMFRKKILELELDNDDLERTERAATSSLSDLEVKLNKAIERNVILENEIAAKDNLTEQTQRLKDELNEVNTELAVLRDKSSKQSEFIQELENKLEDSEKSRKDLLQQQQRAGTPERGNYYYEPYNRTNRTRIPRTPSIGGNMNGMSTISSASSNPVKMVQEMVGRVRSLESRLQSCRSLVTPLLNPPPSYSSTIPASNIIHRDSTMHSRPSSPSSIRSGSPMNFANIKARRPSEYMRASPMDTSEDGNGEED
ncbi:NADH:ubiquinone oxidoreductase [Apophysomyces ossiformis]|uniref:NADH:ubiquinone oxidoreductase n=1 Tax=Apophysomyces ossiformis TaxID=679940 RepID=A0A8H7BDI3_9FUNG|nr:NADH:ubiquinone oxidoreductase [Apophysomyces ossiformis]